MWYLSDYVLQKELELQFSNFRLPNLPIRVAPEDCPRMARMGKVSLLNLIHTLTKLQLHLGRAVRGFVVQSKQIAHVGVFSVAEDTFYLGDHGVFLKIAINYPCPVRKSQLVCVVIFFFCRQRRSGGTLPISQWLNFDLSQTKMLCCIFLEREKEIFEKIVDSDEVARRRAAARESA